MKIINELINIFQPLMEPTTLGVPATEGVLTEVGVRDCRLGVPFAGVLGERLSSWGTGVLGGLIGLDIVDGDHNNLISCCRLFQART